MKKTIRNIIILTIFIMLININKNYAFNNTYYDSIEGCAYENIDGKEIKDCPKIKGIKVKLYDKNDNYIKETTTDEEGKYKFEGMDVGKYKIRFMWGDARDEHGEINVESEQKFNDIQNIIKYNAQDYSSTIKESENRIKQVQIYLLIDKSGSMSGDRMSKAKELAKEITESLLGEDKALEGLANVQIGLIEFDNNANRLNELTDDINSLKMNIDKIDAKGGTEVANGLELAHSDANFNWDNRFLFLLSDGETNNINRVKKDIEDFLNEGIKTFALYIGSDPDNVKGTYEKAEFEDTNIEGIDSKEIIEDIVDDFINYLQAGIGYDVLEDQEQRERINNYFKILGYENTVNFEALNTKYLDIKSRINELNKFKEQVKNLSVNTSIEGKSARICRITDPKNEDSVAISYNGPNLRLTKRPIYSIKPNITIIGQAVILSNGAVIDNVETNLNENKILLSNVQEQFLYGSEVLLQCDLRVKNEADMHNYDNIGILCYVPDGFEINNNYRQKVFGKDKDGNYKELSKVELRKIDLSSSNINSFQKLVSPEIKDKILKGEKIIYIEIKGINQEDNFEFKRNEEIEIKFVISKLIGSSEENMYYTIPVEIGSYSNELSRRTVYFEPSTSGLYGATAANFSENEPDFRDSSNSGIVVIPTGYSKINLEDYIILLYFILIILLDLIKVKSKKYK